MAKILISLLAVIIAVSFAFSVYPPSGIVIENASSTDVNVLVSWQGKSKDFGKIPSQETIEINVKAEAALTFIAEYPDGTEISSAPIYYSSGIKIETTIFSEKVVAEYQSGT